MSGRYTDRTPQLGYERTDIGCGRDDRRSNTGADEPRPLPADRFVVRRNGPQRSGAVWEVDPGPRLVGGVLILGIDPDDHRVEGSPNRWFDQTVTNRVVVEAPVVQRARDRVRQAHPGFRDSCGPRRRRLVGNELRD